MAAVLSSDPMHLGMFEGGPYNHSNDKLEENGGRWYFSRKEIEENSPSRPDGIDLKKETYLRKSYCTFLQDLGMRLKVPQVTIATAIIFSHRFFLRQSLAKNDRRGYGSREGIRALKSLTSNLKRTNRTPINTYMHSTGCCFCWPQGLLTVATVCMFLAGKVEETPRPLKDVILVSYEIIHKKDPEAVQRIKQKDVYEQQKELILLGERVVLATLGFDFNVLHPYKPLVEAIKKFKVAQNALAQVAWNFVNDGLRTSLCLQFKPHHVAAGAIFLAAKFLKVKLPSDGERVWWQEFDVTPRQLEEVSNQMLELYEQNRVQHSQTSEVVDGSTGDGVTQKAPSRALPVDEEHVTDNGNSQGGVSTSRPESSNLQTSRPAPEHSYPDNHTDHRKTSQNRSNDYGDMNGHSNSDHYEQENSNRRVESSSRYDSEGRPKEDQGRAGGGTDTGEYGEVKKYNGRKVEYKGQSPQDAINKIDKDKVKAALQKRRTFRGSDSTRRTDFMDEDDLIERELEDGIELVAESEKSKQETKPSWSKPSNQLEGGQYHSLPKGQSSHCQDFDVVEEGEV